MQSSERLEKRNIFQRILSLNIRNKIILPYLLLTLTVAVVGIYVVTRLVASSLDERLTNQLLEAGRVVSDSLVRREVSHLESARIVAFTRGLNEAMAAHDQPRVAALAAPVASGLGIENLVVVDAQGREMLHLLEREDGSLKPMEGQWESLTLWVGQTLIKTGNPTSLPKRILGVHPANLRYYYLTAIPVGVGEQMVGAVIVGSSLDKLLTYFKATSLADVIVYLDGRVVATTFALQEFPSGAGALLDELAILPELYENALNNTATTSGENTRIYGRWYRLARGPLQVGNDKLGVFAVALPSNFIIQAGATSRTNYTLLFLGAMVCVVLVGYIISQRITFPLSSLVRTSHAVAEGDLRQRTGISRTDEIGVLATTFDRMTERLAERTDALEKLLKTQEETSTNLRAILASIRDGVLLGDVSGNFTPLNDTARQLLDEMAANFLFAPLQELSASESGQDADTPSTAWTLEHRRFQVGKNVISMQSANVQTDAGQHLGKVIVLRDVTAEVEAEQLKDAFVAHVSHELRTPLTAIKGYSQLLLTTSGGTLDDHQRNFLQTISHNTDELIEMINGLLDFSEMEAKGRLGLQRQTVSFSALIERVAAEWQPHMQEKELTFEVTMADNLPRVEADARRLRWAIVNLVRNAWQYTPEGGKVTLRSYAEAGWLVLDVIDTGVGISPEDQQQLFSRFHRAKNLQEDEMRGLGLGLYVTKTIIEAHGGEIRVASKEGVGSTFSMRIPTL